MWFAGNAKYPLNKKYNLKVNFQKEREELKKTAKLQLELNSNRQKYVFEYANSGKSKEQVDNYIQQIYDSYSKLDNPERQMDLAMQAARNKGYIINFKLEPEIDEAEIEKDLENRF